MRLYTLVLSIGLIGIFLGLGVTQAYSTPLFRPVVVVFGDSSQVRTTVNTLMVDYPSAIILKYQDIHSLFDTLTLIRSHAPLILVGHGSDYGILGPNGEMISWQDIGAWLNSLPSTYVFFLSCDSRNAPKYSHIPGYGFTGTIDGVFGDINVVAILQYANGNKQAEQQLVSQYISKAMVLQTD